MSISRVGWRPGDASFASTCTAGSTIQTRQPLTSYLDGLQLAWLRDPSIDFRRHAIVFMEMLFAGEDARERPLRSTRLHLVL